MCTVYIQVRRWAMKTPTELEKFRDELKKADIRDANAFHTIIERGIRILRLTDEDLSRAFSISRPTITRWRNGSNAPHVALRRPVYDWLKKRVTTLIARDNQVVPAGRSYHFTPMAAKGR